MGIDRKRLADLLLAAFEQPEDEIRAAYELRLDEFDLFRITLCEDPDVASC